MMRSVVVVLALSLAACDGAVDDPDAGRLPEGVIASPDGEGFCCAPEEPSCDALIGGFIEEPTEQCPRIFDAAPPAFSSLMTDEHGCQYYEVAQEPSCNPPPIDGGT
jgi:hypothetical protein